MKVSTIIIILSVFLVLFLGYQNELVQKLIGPVTITIGEKKSVIPSDTVKVLNDISGIFPSAEVSPESAEEPTASTAAPRTFETQPTNELQDVQWLQYKLQLLEYRLQHLEADFEDLNVSVGDKENLFDSLLALLGTLMPLVITIVTIKYKRKIDSSSLAKRFSKSA